MKFCKYISPLLLLIFVWIGVTGSTQEWSEPVNISPDLPGLDNQPDLCIDYDGTLHCVFTHKLDQNWRRIYYSKSTDDGLSWTVPEDISLNEDTSLMNPHIICDTNNILYLAYDYNTGNPAQTMIYIKTFSGTEWSAPELVTEGLPGSDHNQLVIDHNNRIYCFWYRNGESNYKYYEDGIWSEVIIPYPDEYYWLIGPVAVDDDDNLHCIGAWLEEGQMVTNISVIYFNYLKDVNAWTDKTIISNETYIGANNWGIDLDNENLPHVAYRQKTSGTGQYSDSTMYTFNNGNSWTEPELVVNDPYEQRIVIDQYKRTHIIDREKSETGYKLVHHRNIGEFWQGYIVDNTDINISNPTVIVANNILYLVYYNCFADDDCKIMFTTNSLPTNLKRFESLVKEINIYPNPFRLNTSIEFEIISKKSVDLSIYNLNGEMVVKLIDEFINPGKYKINWNGLNEKNQEISAGIYIMRFQSGKEVIAKPIEYLN